MSHPPVNNLYESSQGTSLTHLCMQSYLLLAIAMIVFETYLVAMGLTVAKSFVTNSLANFTALTFIFSDSSISKCTNHIFAGSTFSQAGATTNNLLSDCRDLGKSTTTDLYFTNA